MVISNLIKWFAGDSGRQSVRPRRTTHLEVESLECREVPATGVTASLSGGVHRIGGTDKADNIQVMQDGGRITVADQYTNQFVRINGSTSVAVSGLSRIVINAKGSELNPSIGMACFCCSLMSRTSISCQAWTCRRSSRAIASWRN